MRHTLSTPAKRITAIRAQLSEGRRRAIGWISDGSTAKAVIGVLTSFERKTGKTDGLKLTICCEDGRKRTVSWRVGGTFTSGAVESVIATEDGQTEQIAVHPLGFLVRTERKPGEMRNNERYQRVTRNGETREFRVELLGNGYIRVQSHSGQSSLIDPETWKYRYNDLGIWSDVVLGSVRSVGI